MDIVRNGRSESRRRGGTLDQSRSPRLGGSKRGTAGDGLGDVAVPNGV